MNTSFSTQTSTKVYISQVYLTPQSVAAKSSELQSAMEWGLKVGSFIISLYCLAAFIRYVLDISRK